MKITTAMLLIWALWAMGALFFLSLALLPLTLAIGPWGDKIIHLNSCVFLMLPAVIMFRPRWYLSLALAIMLAGVGIEFVQQLVPDREFSYGDMAVNISGLLLGIVIGILLRRGYSREPLQ